MVTYPSRRRKPKPIPEPTSWQIDERERIARSEALLAAVSDTPEKAALIEAMLQRAYDLMWEHRCEECDAITDWLPPLLVREMLDAWCDDNEGKLPKSRWY